MSKERILAVVRHTLTFAGGLLVMKGIVDEAMVSEIVGGVISLAGMIWSIFDKK